MAKSSLSRSILLLLLILIVAAGGLVWFDYLNVIDVKTVLAPIYNKIGISGRSQPRSESGEPLNLDAERLAVRLEALDLREKEMDKTGADIEQKRGEVAQMAAELEDRQKTLDEREKTINAVTELQNARERNVEQNSRYLSGMPPQNAVAIIAAMDDQEAIDVMRKTEEIARAEGAASIVSFWFSLLPPERAAELQRKMSARP
ncbi:flagellar protein FlbB [Spirochaetia bacterium]|nr:flagellar protein FlbB [Spirochaetia bacterium]